MPPAKDSGKESAVFNAYSFFAYILITAFTPGPNNILSMSNAGKYGFRKSFPFNMGILAGQLAVVSLCSLFSASLYALAPAIQPFMTALGAAYMLYLAWKTLKSGEGGEKSGLVAGNSFLAGALLQFVNMKYVIYCITAMSSYILPHFRSLPIVAAFAALLAFTGFSATVLWALFGSAFHRLFEKHARGLNAVMALLLVYCAVSLYL